MYTMNTMFGVLYKLYFRANKLVKDPYKRFSPWTIGSRYNFTFGPQPALSLILTGKIGLLSSPGI